MSDHYDQREALHAAVGRPSERQRPAHQCTISEAVTVDDGISLVITASALAFLLGTLHRAGAIDREITVRTQHQLDTGKWLLTLAAAPKANADLSGPAE